MEHSAMSLKSSNKFNGKAFLARDAATNERESPESGWISALHCGENQSDPRARAKVRDAVSSNVAR